MRAITWDDLNEPGKATDFFSEAPGPFRPEAAAYDDVNAWWLIELSRLAYRDRPGRAPFLAATSIDEINAFDHGEIECYLVRARDRRWAALVFRGTASLQNWVTNVELKFAPWTTGEVHEGFKEALDGVWQAVLPALEQLDAPLFYTGHSLGAALATLAASRRAPRATYTFGSPLVGNRAFATTIDPAHMFRVVNHLDVVTTVPPSALGYQHVGELHKIGEETPLIAGFKFDPLSLFRELEHPPEPLADHAPVYYSELIRLRIKP